MAEILQHRVYRRIGLTVGTELPSGENRWQVNAVGATPVDEWLASGPGQALDYWRAEAAASSGSEFDVANWQTNEVGASPMHAWQITAVGQTMDYWRATAP